MTPHQQRDRELQDAYSAAQIASTHYADVNAAQAAQLLREHFPTAARAHFFLYETSDAGYSAGLSSVYDADGQLLWDDDQDQPHPIDGDTAITDRLATAETWHDNYFPRVAGSGSSYELNIGAALHRDTDYATAGEPHPDAAAQAQVEAERLPTVGQWGAEPDHGYVGNGTEGCNAMSTIPPAGTEAKRG